MHKEIEQFLKQFILSLQVGRIYTSQHPKFNESVDNVFEKLQEILTERPEVVIGIIGSEFAFEKEIFFDLSQRLSAMITYLKEKGIERLAFSQGIDKDETARCINTIIKYNLNPEESLQKLFNRLGIRNVSVSKLKASTQAAEIDISETVSNLKYYEDTIGELSKSINATLEDDAVDYLGLRLTVTNVMEKLIGSYHEFLRLATAKSYDKLTFNHLLNVSILSMYFSSKLGFAKEDVLDIGIAALFHDIGKLYISRKIVQKPDRLTDEEFDTMKSHAVVGAEILLKYKDSLGIVPIVVVFEHHMRFDMKGYPKTYFSQRPHVFSSIVSICDVYDALIQRRTYKQDYPPDAIYRLMMKERGRMFSPDLLEGFFKIIGVWPVGTIVHLNDGRTAVVREINPDNIFAPRVEVIFPHDKKEILDLSKVGDSVKIEYVISLKM
ncbi:MAG: HD domain-containing phosphohydrolase [Candidatus Omnitrophota bacterium]